MAFQDNLKQAREYSGYTAKELAGKLNIPYGTYVSYENRGREPKYEVLCKIADALHVSTDNLLGHDINDLEKCKNILIKGGIKIHPVSPPGCTSIYAPILPALEKKHPELKNMPIALPNEKIIEWVSMAIPIIEDKQKELLHKELIETYLSMITYDIMKDHLNKDISEHGSTHMQFIVKGLPTNMKNKNLSAQEFFDLYEQGSIEVKVNNDLKDDSSSSNK